MDFYYPGKKFPAISVTGTRCELNCPHCQGRYLASMVQADLPEKILAFCHTLEERGGLGCLISGGCDAMGRVPLPLETLGEIRQSTDLIVNVHTGFIDPETAAALRDIQPQYISFDVPTPTVLKRVYRLPLTQNEYMESLSLVEDLTVVPHVMVGLNVEEEIRTFTLLSERGMSTVVVLVCTPTPKTPSQTWTISVDAIAASFRSARSQFTRVMLGCMRPRLRAIEEMAPLFDGIAVPTRIARDAVREAGQHPVVRETCCVVP
ncbi:MAG: hypothetical protein HXS53_06850 [Theionarchaea archaeon]|nr:hypothetical protein [Theionarchaea archaeon]